MAEGGLIKDIPLPYGKQYHLFISHCEEDEAYATAYMEELENKYGLKCLHHKRDFLPGESTMKNVIDGIEKSMKITYLISKNFKESGMCMTEVAYGILASHRNSRNCMIPVLIDDTEIPSELQTITYIEAKVGGMDIPAKIYEAFQFGDTENCILPNVIPFEGTFNGTDLILMQGNPKLSCCLSTLQFPVEGNILVKIKDQTRVEQLRRMVADVSIELNSSRFCRYHFIYGGCNSFYGFFLPLIYLGPLGFAFLVFFLHISTSGRLTTSSDTITTASIAIPASFLLIPMALCCILLSRRYQYKYEAEMKLWTIWLRYYKITKGLALLRNDWTEFVFRVLKRKEAFHLIDDERVREHAEELVLDGVSRYRRLLVSWSTLPLFRYNRHNTALQRNCICQLLEPDIV